MGENKLLLDFCGKPLVEWVIENVSSIGFKKIILVYKDKEVLKIAKRYKVDAIYNKNSYLGQSESIKVALENIKISSDCYMFFTGDQPLLKKDTIEKIINKFYKKGGIVIPRVCGKNKSPTIFSSCFKEELLNIEGDVGGRVVIKNNLDKVSFVDFDSDVDFFDVDTKEELEYLRRRYYE